MWLGPQIHILSAIFLFHQIHHQKNPIEALTSVVFSYNKSTLILQIYKFICFTNKIVVRNVKKPPPSPRPPAPHIASTNFSKTNETEDVIFLIPNLSTWKTTQVKNSKSPAKLIKLFENSQFAKQFCITRENVKQKIRQMLVYI